MRFLLCLLLLTASGLASPYIGSPFWDVERKLGKHIYHREHKFGEFYLIRNQMGEGYQVETDNDRQVRRIERWIDYERTPSHQRTRYDGSRFSPFTMDHVRDFAREAVGEQTWKNDGDTIVSTDGRFRVRIDRTMDADRRIERASISIEDVSFGGLGAPADW